MDYRIKKVGDGWEFLPEKERKEKFDYERLLNNIKRREKRIENETEKLKKLKNELREWNKKRTVQHHQLIKYHKEFIPTFSTSLSKNQKFKDSDNIEGSFTTSGNKSWTISVRVQGIRKSIYLGTQQKVNEMLDLIEGRSDHWINLYPHKNSQHLEKITKKIEDLVYPLIKEEMLIVLNENGSLDSFMNETIKGMKYLDNLYLNSGYYEERQPMNPKLKGKFTTYNPSFIKKK